MLLLNPKDYLTCIHLLHLLSRLPAADITTSGFKLACMLPAHSLCTVWASDVLQMQIGPHLSVLKTSSDFRIKFNFLS